MSDLYTGLLATPRKKRSHPEDFDDDTFVTPKRLRTMPATPPSTVRKANKSPPLPSHLTRLSTIHIALQHALSHALATCAVSPSSDTGLVCNVLNHLSLTTYAGLTTKFDVDDLKRLCWLWEWDGKILPDTKGKAKSNDDDDDNPFLEPKPAQVSKDWTRGSMGLVISPTTHFSKTAGKRVPAYGIGIEVEMDLDKYMGGGMAAVARWTAAAETRRKNFRQKLDKWAELHPDVSPTPQIPMADLPELQTAPKISSLTRTLVSASPKGLSSIPFPALASPSKSPTKRSAALREFAVPLPVTPSKASALAKNSFAFPQTPSRRNRGDLVANLLLTPSTPSTSSSSTTSTPTTSRTSIPSEPSTPVRQRGPNAVTVPQTPTSSRRQALYERVRLRSLTSTPTKPAASKEVVGGKLTKEQIMKLGQEEMRRRCLLGRLGGVAESVWMLFSNPVGSVSIPTTRKRRALPTSEVATAVIKSSPVPISSAEAHESLKLLTKLCPFFLKPLNITGDEWLEMPATTSSGEGGEGKVPPSPSRVRRKNESAEEVLTKSPRRVKKETGGLREVREIIRRELELQD